MEYIKTRAVAQAFADKYGNVRVRGGYINSDPRFVNLVRTAYVELAIRAKDGEVIATRCIFWVKEEGEGYLLSWRNDAGAEIKEPYATLEAATDAARTLAMILKP